MSDNNEVSPDSLLDLVIDITMIACNILTLL